MRDLINTVISEVRSKRRSCEINTSEDNRTLVTVKNLGRTGQIDQTIHETLEDIDSNGTTYFFTDRLSDDKAEVLFSQRSKRPHLYTPRLGLKMGLDQEKTIGPAVRLCYSLPEKYHPEEAKKIAISSLIICQATRTGDDIDDTDKPEIYGTKLDEDELQSYAEKFSDKTDLIEYNKQNNAEDSSDASNRTVFDW